jgi:hypothetical protein
MTEIHAEIAAHTPRAGMYAVRLFGGPWDGKEVGVHNPDAPFIQVNGPRRGKHSIWITHLYQRREGRYEFVSTEVVPLTAWRIKCGENEEGSQPAEQPAPADRPRESRSIELQRFVPREEAGERDVRPDVEINQVDELARDIARTAEDAVALCEYVCGVPLDYSEVSLAVVEDTLRQTTSWSAGLTPEQLQNVARTLGCYVLEVARRQFGGRYCWFERRNAPVLVVGEPSYRVTLLTWVFVQGRLAGDAACNIPFFYAGFAERARLAEPGTDALYV